MNSDHPTLDISYKSIFLRYVSLLVIGAIFATGWLYKALLPATIYPTYFILAQFQKVALSGSIIFMAGSQLEIVPACAAVSAYFLLAILTVSTPLPLKKILKVFFFSSLLLLVANVVRIIILSFLFINGSASFDIVHGVFWYLLSVVFVILAWFFTVAFFKIKNIPFYDDIKHIYGEIRK